MARASDINDVLAYGASLERASGQFVQQRSLLGLPIPLQSTGRFEYSNTDGLVWHTLEPLESRLVIASSGIEGLPFGGDAQGSHFFSEILLAVFKGDVSALSPYFDVGVTQNSETWHIKLAPKGALLSNAIAMIELQGSRFLERIVIQEKSGDSSNISLSAELLTVQDAHQP